MVGALPATGLEGITDGYPFIGCVSRPGGGQEMDWNRDECIMHVHQEGCSYDVNSTCLAICRPHQLIQGSGKLGSPPSRIKDQGGQRYGAQHLLQ